MNEVTEYLLLGVELDIRGKKNKDDKTQFLLIEAETTLLQHKVCCFV